MFNLKQGCVLFCLLSFGVALITCHLQIAILLWVIFVTGLVMSKISVRNLANIKNPLNSSWIVSVIPYISFVQNILKADKNGQIIKTVESKLLEIGPTDIESQTDLIVSYVSRDFIEAWFLLLSDNRTVIDGQRFTLSDLKKTTLQRLSQSDKYKFLQQFVVLFHKHLHEIQKAQHFIRVQPKYRLKRDRSKEFKKVKSVEETFENNGLFHHALEDQEREITYLSSILDLCFKEMLGKDVYTCQPACNLVIDITSTNALIKLLDLVSDPSWLHFFIIKLTSDKELELVKQPETIAGVPNFEEHKTGSGSVEEHESTQKEANFYFESSDDHEIPKERPNPLGCTDDEVFNSMEIEVQSTKDEKTKGDFHSSIEVAERNGIFDLNLFPHSVSGQTFEPMHVEQAEDAWAKAPERYEQPLNLIVEVNIIGSEKMKEAGTMGVYTIYVIEYLAWYKTSGGTWQVQSRTVKRRYREFVALQERIEEHPTLKHQLKKIKGIKGPSKWLNLPFSRMDEAYINRRRIFLTEYLRSIVDNRELSYSLAVREFLAYEGDPGIAFVRKPSDVQRIDQVFVQTVKSVGNALEKFTDSLPSLTETKVKGHSRESSRDLSHAASDVWPTGQDPDQIQVTCECITQQLLSDTHVDKMQSAVVAYDELRSVTQDADMTSFHDVLEVNHLTLPRLQADGSDSVDNTQGLDSKIPLTQCLLDLALQTISDRDCWVQNEHAVKLFKVLLGRFLDSFVRNELDLATTPQRCAYYFWEITDTLWPNGRFDDSPPREISDEQRELTRKQARRCLFEFFPGFLPHIIGVDDFNHAVDEVMAALDNPKLNRHFALCLLDVAVEEIFPEICTPELQKQLLQVTDEHYLPRDTYM